MAKQPTGRPPGRPPTPTEQKRLLGNPGHRPLPPVAAVTLTPANGCPDTPDTLGEVGSDMWARVWNSPAKNWLSPEVDHMRVRGTCELADEVRALRLRIETDGLVYLLPVFDPTGKVAGARKTIHPAVAALRMAERELHAGLSALGLDPVARARLGVAEVRRQNVLEELMARRTARAAARRELAG